MIARLKFKFLQTNCLRILDLIRVYQKLLSDLAHPCDPWALIKSGTYGLIEGILHDSSVMNILKYRQEKTNL